MLAFGFVAQIGVRETSLLEALLRVLWTEPGLARPEPLGTAEAIEFSLKFGNTRQLARATISCILASSFCPRGLT